MLVDNVEISLMKKIWKILLIALGIIITTLFIFVGLMIYGFERGFDPTPMMTFYSQQEISIKHPKLKSPFIFMQQQNHYTLAIPYQYYLYHNDSLLYLESLDDSIFQFKVYQFNISKKSSILYLESDSNRYYLQMPNLLLTEDFPTHLPVTDTIFIGLIDVQNTSLDFISGKKYQNL